MRTLLSFAGRIGSTIVSGTFVRLDSGDVAFCRKVGRDAASATWVPVDLPTAFRSQQDVNSTASMLGARVVGGVSSYAVIGDKSSIGWKEERGWWTLEDVLARLDPKDAAGVTSFYAEEAEAAA